jgi:tRNA A-37 threonylcarbamoyl transferase component Bud32
MINATFSQTALDAVAALLFAEPAVQKAPEATPCPPAQPKPPAQPPAQPPQPQPPSPPAPPQPVTAAQQDPAVVKQQKKQKCTAQAAAKGVQSAPVNHSETMDFARCQRPDGTYYGTAGKCRKGTEVGAKNDSGYDSWKSIAEGNYGKISVSPDGKRVVKTLLEHNGVRGEFGEYEVELATKMGELGHSPKIHSHGDEFIEMDLAKGRPLWKSYLKAEGESRMNTEQATKAAAAIRALHELGFAHGDLHSQQFMVNGNEVKLVDYGLSLPTKRQPSRVMQDLSKIDNLISWRNPDLADDPYFKLVNKHLNEYKEVKGTSKAAQNKKVQIAEAYLRELNRL